MVTHMIIVARGKPLDLELTLILVAIGLAFLFTATAVISYLFPVCRIMPRKLLPQQPVDDSGQVQKSTNKRKIFQPTMTSTPIIQMPALPQRLNQTSRQLMSIPTQRSPTLFATSMVKQMYPVPPPHQPNASYNGPTPGFYNHRISPPKQSHPSHYRRPHYALPALPSPLPSARSKVVSPHVAGWTKIADDVVGRHPFAKPLVARVATQAEVAFISDRVPVRWAHDTRRSQPTQPKVLKPVHKQKRFSATAETNGGFPLRDKDLNRIEEDASPSRIRLQGQNGSVGQNDHSQERAYIKTLQQA